MDGTKGERRRGVEGFESELGALRREIAELRREQREQRRGLQEFRDMANRWRGTIGVILGLGALVSFLPFSPVSLSQGTIYNIRGRVSGSGQFFMGANQGWEHSNVQKSPRGLSSWAEHQAQNRRPLGGWRDSRGTMISTDGGSSWSFWAGLSRKVAPIALQRVV